jgi:hypothetical protein
MMKGVFMAKVDAKKVHRELYNPSVKAPAMVTVPDFLFIQIDGAGDPNTAAAFQDTVQALYGLAYTLKFMLKKRGGDEFVVPPLEGLWWCADMSLFSTEHKGDWLWTMMIQQPREITAADFEQARETLRKKKNPPLLEEARLESYFEGLCAQIMHLGPYAEEAPTIERLHRFILDSGCRLTGKHHEIYLSDPRRGDPAKMKTIIRQPVEKV